MECVFGIIHECKLLLYFHGVINLHYLKNSFYKKMNMWKIFILLNVQFLIGIANHNVYYAMYKVFQNNTNPDTENTKSNFNILSSLTYR